MFFKLVSKHIDLRSMYMKVEQQITFISKKKIGI